jgi:hypothetical protein
VKYSTFLVSLIFTWSTAHGAEFSTESAALKARTLHVHNSRTPPVVAVTSSGLGQAGYVHYFLITHSDNSLEYHVGIELDDQRIAWSFPNAGVIVSEFVKNGTINANGKNFKIEHLHGIRPFSNDAQMRMLQKELPQRVAQWVDNETPYCLFRAPGEPFCLSCGDFVVRILYPGTLPLIPSLPKDFSHAPGTASTTDDLLLYLVGIYNLPDKYAKLARLATLDLPANMRADIITMIEDNEPDESEPATAIAATPLPATKPPVITASPAAKPVQSKIASRRPQNKKL